jgi:hypothetical protein
MARALGELFSAVTAECAHNETGAQLFARSDQKAALGP